MADRQLHGTLRDARQLGENTVAHGNGVPARTVCVTVELQVHKKCRAGSAMRYEIAHQDVDEIRVSLHDYSNGSYSNSCMQSCRPG